MFAKRLLVCLIMLMALCGCTPKQEKLQNSEEILKTVVLANRYDSATVGLEKYKKRFSDKIYSQLGQTTESKYTPSWNEREQIFKASLEFVDNGYGEIVACYTESNYLNYIIHLRYVNQVVIGFDYTAVYQGDPMKEHYD